MRIARDNHTGSTTFLPSISEPQVQRFASSGRSARHFLHFILSRASIADMATASFNGVINARTRVSKPIAFSAGTRARLDAGPPDGPAFRAINYLNPHAHCTSMDIRCPMCGGAMEPGFLGAESLLQGVKWYEKKSILALDGEKIKDPDLSGMVYMDALRCKVCRIVLTKY